MLISDSRLKTTYSGPELFEWEGECLGRRKKPPSSNSMRAWRMESALSISAGSFASRSGTWEDPLGGLEVDCDPGGLGGTGQWGVGWGMRVQEPELTSLGSDGMMLLGQPHRTCQQAESEVSWGLEASLAITRARISTP